MLTPTYSVPMSPAEWSIIIDALDREDERLHQDRNTSPRRSPTQRAQMVRDLLHKLWQANLGAYYSEIIYSEPDR